MAAILGRLVASRGATASLGRYAAGAAVAERATKSLTRQMKSSNSFMELYGRTVNNVGHQIERFTARQDFASSIGATSQAVGGLERALDLAGASADLGADALRQITTIVDAAKFGDPAAFRALTELGIDPQKWPIGDISAQAHILQDRLGEVRRNILRARGASQAFGDDWRLVAKTFKEIDVDDIIDTGVRDEEAKKERQRLGRRKQAFDEIARKASEIGKFINAPRHAAEDWVARWLIGQKEVTEETKRTAVEVERITAANVSDRAARNAMESQVLGGVPTIIPGQGTGQELEARRARSAVTAKAGGLPFGTDSRTAGLKKVEETRDREMELLEEMVKLLDKGRNSEQTIGALRLN